MTTASQARKNVHHPNKQQLQEALNLINLIQKIKQNVTNMSK